MNPPKKSTPPAELLQAFADIHYIVHHESPFAMHIGKPSPDLKALMAEHNALSAAAWHIAHGDAPQALARIRRAQSNFMQGGAA